MWLMTEEMELEDSIRATQRTHRRPDVSAQILQRIEDERRPTALPTSATGHSEPLKPARLIDTLPLSPERTAKLGLTSILPPMKVRREKAFRAFIIEITEPDFKVRYPTWTALSQHFGVSVPTIRAWMLSEEVGKAVRASVSHEAAMSLPSVMRAVRIRAELTGDPHAAEMIRKIAKMGTAETDQAASFERTLKQIAHDRINKSLPKSASPKVIDITPVA